MRTVYQNTDDFGHTLRTIKLNREDRSEPVYLGMVIQDREVLYRTRECASRDFVLQKIKDFVAERTPSQELQPA